MARRTQTKGKSRSGARTGTKRGRAATTRRKTAGSRKTAASRKTASRSTTARRRGRLTVTPAMKKIARQMSERMAEQTAPADATALLKQDHREVEGFLEQYEQLESKAEKGQLAAKICLTLTIHAMIEQELLYPAAHEETEAVEQDLVDEALVEHASAKQLIAEIEAMKPGEALYDAKVKVLGEYFKHHVKEEENELFPQLQESELDLRDLGERLMQRKLELLARMTGKA